MEKELEVTCLNCGHKNTVPLEDVRTDELGDFVKCIACESTFDVER